MTSFWTLTAFSSEKPEKFTTFCINFIKKDLFNT